MDRRLPDEPPRGSPAGGGRARQTIPDLRYPQSRPGRASPRALGVTRSYAARAKFVLAVENFPSVLPGTRGPGHAATASLIPSKPVAPVALKLHAEAIQVNATAQWRAPLSHHASWLWHGSLHAVSP